MAMVAVLPGGVAEVVDQRHRVAGDGIRVGEPVEGGLGASDETAIVFEIEPDLAAAQEPRVVRQTERVAGGIGEAPLVPAQSEIAAEIEAGPAERRNNRQVGHDRRRPRRQRHIGRQRGGRDTDANTCDNQQRQPPHAISLHRQYDGRATRPTMRCHTEPVSNAPDQRFRPAKRFVAGGCGARTRVGFGRSCFDRLCFRFSWSASLAVPFCAS